MATHDGGRPATDFEVLPLSLGAGQSVMRDKLATLLAFCSHAAIRDPNAFSMNIHGAGRGLTHRFFQTRSREQRPVHERDGRLARWVRNECGKHTGVLVIHAIKSDAIIRLKSCEPNSTPVKHIIRD